MNVGEMQRKLSLWAEQDKDHRFYDLYHLLYDTDWLQLAHIYVSQNAGSQTAGCDGINMRAFDENLDKNIHQLAQELKSEAFQPYPVRRVYIEKKSGKLRPLGIPSIRDRIAQEAIRMILEPIYEADFSQRSFGFRPNRCTMDAINYITLNTIGNRKFHWIIEGDISSYFDTIKHKRLMKFLGHRIKDKKLLRLIWKFLKSGVMENKLFQDTKTGVPQGGIASPILANVYLHELDKYIERYTNLSPAQRRRRRLKGLANYIYARYCDDFVVLCNGTKKQAEEMKEELRIFLKDELRIELSIEKTKVTHLNDGFQFLGFRIWRCRTQKGINTIVTIPKEAMDNVREKIKRATDPATHSDSVYTKILALNRIVGGWCRYYQYTGKATRQFSEIDYYLFWRMAHWLGRKFSLSIPEVMKRYMRNNTFVYEGCWLKRPSDYKTRRYRPNPFKPNPYTTLEYRIEWKIDEYPQAAAWTGRESRPGWADLRQSVIKRDDHTCRMCEKTVTAKTAQVDHIKGYGYFKLPVNANVMDNLQTLCIECHKLKAQAIANQ